MENNCIYQICNCSSIINSEKDNEDFNKLNILLQKVRNYYGGGQIYWPVTGQCDCASKG